MAGINAQVEQEKTAPSVAPTNIRGKILKKRILILLMGDKNSYSYHLDGSNKLTSTMPPPPQQMISKKKMKWKNILSFGMIKLQKYSSLSFFLLSQTKPSSLHPIFPFIFFFSKMLSKIEHAPGCTAAEGGGCGVCLAALEEEVIYKYRFRSKIYAKRNV